MTHGTTIHNEVKLELHSYMHGRRNNERIKHGTSFSAAEEWAVSHLPDAT